MSGRTFIRSGLSGLLKRPLVAAAGSYLRARGERRADAAAVTAIGKPVPGPDLIWRATGARSPRWFLESGERSVGEMDAVLARAGSRLDSHDRILDFGCGCGRVLLWLDGLAPETELIGTDVDREAVEWARTHIPYAQLLVNQPLPPLALPDGAVDLVINHSVFTHLDETFQDAWLAELRRLTRPDALVLLTVHGEHAWERSISGWKGENLSGVERYERRWRDHGFVFVENADEWEGAFPDFYHSAFHAPWYLESHWSRFFIVEEHAARASLDFQDYVLLRRPRDE
jgi:SAM-dependent methyltransferase